MDPLNSQHLRRHSSSSNHLLVFRQERDVLVDTDARISFNDGSGDLLLPDRILVLRVIPSSPGGHFSGRYPVTLHLGSLFGYVRMNKIHKILMSTLELGEMLGIEFRESGQMLQLSSKGGDDAGRTFGGVLHISGEHSPPTAVTVAANGVYPKAKGCPIAPAKLTRLRAESRGCPDGKSSLSESEADLSSLHGCTMLLERDETDGASAAAAAAHVSLVESSNSLDRPREIRRRKRMKETKELDLYSRQFPSPVCHLQDEPDRGKKTTLGEEESKVRIALSGVPLHLVTADIHLLTKIECDVVVGEDVLVISVLDGVEQSLTLQRVLTEILCHSRSLLRNQCHLLVGSRIAGTVLSCREQIEEESGARVAVDVEGGKIFRELLYPNEWVVTLAGSMIAVVKAVGAVLTVKC